MPVPSSRKLGRMINWGYQECNFRSRPAVSLATGGAAVGTTGAVNSMAFPLCNFEYFILGAGQTIIAPVLVATGLDVSLDLTTAEGLEISQGITARSPSAYTVGTHAFYAEMTFILTDVSGTAACLFGFRKAAAYAAAWDDYTDMVAFNVNAGDITLSTILNNATTTVTDTTQNWADTESHKLGVFVATDRTVTYQIDGAAPTVTAAYTADVGDIFVPFFHLLHTTDVAEGTILQKYVCGLQ